MRQVHFCSFLFQTYNHSITVTQAFPVKNTFNLESFFSGIQIIRSHSPFEVVHLHNVRLNIPYRYGIFNIYRPITHHTQIQIQIINSPTLKIHIPATPDDLQSCKITRIDHNRIRRINGQRILSKCLNPMFCELISFIIHSTSCVISNRMSPIFIPINLDFLNSCGS